MKLYTEGSEYRSCFKLEFLKVYNMSHIHIVHVLIEFLKSLLELHDTDTDITILRYLGVYLPGEKA
jgi:hypothetical protein